MRRIITKRLIAFVILCGIAIVLCTGFNTKLQVANVYFNKIDKKLPIYSVQTDKQTVAISFDAAWGADKTSEIMSICEEYGVKATFFLVGFWVQDYPDVAKSIADRGFEIGLHSSTHPDMSKLSASQVELELSKNVDIIETVCQVEPKLFRPPFGAYNNQLIDICKRMNITPIQWSVDSLDWKNLGKENILNRVLSKTKNGSIILMHNGTKDTANVLDEMIKKLKEKGFNFKPTSEFIYRENYTIDHAGKQIKN